MENKMYNYKIEVIEDGKIIKEEYVKGTYEDAESVMCKYWRQGYNSNIKNVK